MPSLQLSLRSLFFLTSAVAFGLYAGRLDPTFGLFVVIILLLARRRALALTKAEEAPTKRGALLRGVTRWALALLTEITICLLSGGVVFYGFIALLAWLNVTLLQMSVTDETYEQLRAVIVWSHFTLWLALQLYAHDRYLVATLERRPKLPETLPTLAPVVAESAARGATRRKLTRRPGTGLNPPERFRRNA